MNQSSSLLVLCLAGAVATVAVAQPGPITTDQKSTLYFPALTLTTNGIPGLTNVAPHLMVSSVNTASAYGGAVSLINTQAWVRRYNGPANSSDAAEKVSVDPDGNACLVGSSVGTLNYDLFTWKYASDGTLLWTNRYNGPDHRDDFGRALALDDMGNVYVAGNSEGPVTKSDVVVIKYGTNGSAIWVNRYNRFGTNVNYPVGLGVDGAGNAYVLVSTAYDVRDFTTIKYDAAGNALWTNHFAISDTGTDDPAAIVVDRDGGIYVTGGTDLPSLGRAFATLKYANDGSFLWTNYFQLSAGPGSNYEAQASNLTLDRSNNVIVTGDLFTTLRQYATIKYANNGTPLWTNFLSTPNYQGGGLPQVAADSDGNVFVIGGSPGASGTQMDFSTTKITRDGAPLWTNRFSDGTGFLGGMAMDNAGNIYLTGHSTGPGGTNQNYTTVRIAANGTAFWTNRYDGAAHGADYPYSVTVDDAGSVFVAGESYGGTSGYDAATVKYDNYVSYTPAANFTGTDTVTFTVVDPVGHAATGTVSIIVLKSLQFNVVSTNLQWTPQGMRLQVDGARGTNPVILYASSNLADWQPISTNPAVLGSASFVDAGAVGRSKRFYRASQQP